MHTRTTVKTETYERKRERRVEKNSLALLWAHLLVVEGTAKSQGNAMRYTPCEPLTASSTSPSPLVPVSPPAGTGLSCIRALNFCDISCAKLEDMD
jgi:hypothetical protein